MGDRDRWPDQRDPNPDRQGPGQGDQQGGGAPAWPGRQGDHEAEEFGPHGPGSDPDD
jgi:hypothetical protein